ncbi:MAG: PAS domain-containing sensor histidine kinase [Actinomycetota bacterium]
MNGLLVQDPYQDVFQSAPQPMWILDLETLRFLDVNKVSIGVYGYSRAELLLMTNDLAAFALPNKNGRFVKKDGTAIDVQLASSDITFRGRPARLIIPIDVTSQKAAKRALVDADSLVGVERQLRKHEMRATREELRLTNAERRRLLASLVGAQEEERRRISADIHDDSIQVMSALTMRIEGLTRSIQDSDLRTQMESIRSHAELAVHRLRLLLFDLHPLNLVSEGVGSALSAHLDHWKSDSRMDYSFEDRLSTQPPPDVATILFRVGQEALRNIRKHANATRVSVSLVPQDDGVLLSVSDDGVGFGVHPDDLYLPGHIGMQAMREKVEMAGGWLKVTSVPGVGSELVFWVPDHSSIDLRDSSEVSPID